MGDENTMMLYCNTCHKFIYADGMLFHLGHDIGKKSFKQIYNEAVHDSGQNRK